MKRISLLIAIMLSGLIHAQAFDIEGTNMDGQVYFEDGSTQTGKLNFSRLRMAIKPEGGKREKLDVDKVEKFQVFRKKDTVSYTYLLSERNYKKKKKYLTVLVYDGKKVKAYNEPTTAAKIGAFTVGQAIYFVKKKEDPYAILILKAFKNPNKILSEFFQDCPELSGKIGEEFKYKNFDTLKTILDYYENDCQN